MCNLSFLMLLVPPYSFPCYVFKNQCYTLSRQLSLNLGLEDLWESFFFFDSVHLKKGNFLILYNCRFICNCEKQQRDIQYHFLSFFQCNVFENSSKTLQPQFYLLLIQSRYTIVPSVHQWIHLAAFYCSHPFLQKESVLMWQTTNLFFNSIMFHLKNVIDMRLGYKVCT